MKITQKQILEVCAKVDSSIPYLNSGGCAVFAYFLGSILEKFENCKVRVKVKGYSPEKHLNACVPKNNNSPSDWNQNGIHFKHVVLKVKLRNKKPFLIDCEGLYKSEWLHKGSIPVKYLEPIIKSQSGWNSSFEREDIPAMLEILEDYFQDVLADSSPIDITDWELGYATKMELPPSMPKSSVSKIEFYKDNRQAGAGIVLKLKDGLKFASGESIAYPVNVKDAIALMRKVA